MSVMTLKGYNTVVSCLFLHCILPFFFFSLKQIVAMLSLSVLTLVILSAVGGSWVKVVAGK